MPPLLRLARRSRACRVILRCLPVSAVITFGVPFAVCVANFEARYPRYPTLPEISVIANNPFERNFSPFLVAEEAEEQRSPDAHNEHEDLQRAEDRTDEDKKW